MAVAAVDTGVWVEFINKTGKFHSQALAIMNEIKAGGLRALLPKIILVEIYYVSRRIYEGTLPKAAAKEKAEKFYEFIHYQPNVDIVDLDHDQGLRAGEIKYEYGVALPDCHLLALSERAKIPAVFRHREKEFSKELVKNFDLVFLEDYA